MPRVLHTSTRIDMPADEYWALRMDQGFDAFSAERDASTFELIERRNEEQDGKVVEFMQCLLLYKENPVPSSLQHMMGAAQFGFKYSVRWYRDHYDEAHACTFTSEPPVFRDRISVSGRTWLVPAGPTSCDVWYREEISVKVFGVGSVAEQVIEKRMRESLGKLNDISLQYTKTEDYQRFVAARKAADGLRDLAPAAPAAASRESTGATQPTGAAPSQPPPLAAVAAAPTTTVALGPKAGDAAAARNGCGLALATTNGCAGASAAAHTATNGAKTDRSARRRRSTQPSEPTASSQPPPPAPCGGAPATPSAPAEPAAARRRRGSGRGARTPLSDVGRPSPGSASAAALRGSASAVGAATATPEAARVRHRVKRGAGSAVATPSPAPLPPPSAGVTPPEPPRPPEVRTRTPRSSSRRGDDAPALCRRPAAASAGSSACSSAAPSQCGSSCTSPCDAPATTFALSAAAAAAAAAATAATSGAGASSSRGSARPLSAEFAAAASGDRPRQRRSHCSSAGSSSQRSVRSQRYNAESSADLLNVPNRDLNTIWNKEVGSGHVTSSPAEVQGAVAEIALTNDLSLAKTNNGFVVRRVLI